MNREATGAFLNTLSQHLPGVTIENLSQDGRSPGRNSDTDLRNKKQYCCYTAVLVRSLLCHLT